MKFTSIDFETANHTDPSICAAGVATFEDGHLIESLYWLIRPPKGFGWFIDDFIAIHGITHEHVRHAPEFPAIAPQLFDRLTSADLVIAHNAQFDLRKLRGTLAHFGLECPPFKSACTLQLAKRAWPELKSHSLDALAKFIHHEFQHHNAQGDAEAAGWAYLEVIRTLNEL